MRLFGKDFLDFLLQIVPLFSSPKTSSTNTPKEKNNKLPFTKSPQNETLSFRCLKKPSPKPLQSNTFVKKKRAAYAFSKNQTFFAPLSLPGFGISASKRLTKSLAPWATWNISARRSASSVAFGFFHGGKAVDPTGLGGFLGGKGWIRKILRVFFDGVGFIIFLKYKRYQLVLHWKSWLLCGDVVSGA